jgi:hypothetical protein
MQERREAKNVWLSEGNNIWKNVKTVFRPFAPPFKGISTNNGKLTNEKDIVDTLANYYEQHFSPPQHDLLNQSHINSIEIFNNLSYLPAVPLDQIKFEEVLREWENSYQKSRVIVPVHPLLFSKNYRSNISR